jgi:hypothetical protein
MIFYPVGERFPCFSPYEVLGQNGVGAVGKLFNGRGKILQGLPCHLFLVFS